MTWGFPLNAYSFFLLYPNRMVNQAELFEGLCQAKAKSAPVSFRPL